MLHSAEQISYMTYHTHIYIYIHITLYYYIHYYSFMSQFIITIYYIICYMISLYNSAIFCLAGGLGCHFSMFQCSHLHLLGQKFIVGNSKISEPSTGSKQLSKTFKCRMIECDRMLGKSRSHLTFHLDLRCPQPARQIAVNLPEQHAVLICAVCKPRSC